MNSADPINPAEQVERIREILVGRDMALVNDRIQNLETQVQDKSSEVSKILSQQMQKAEQKISASHQEVQQITAHIRQQLQQETGTRTQQINDLAKKIDEAAARMDETSRRLLSVEADRGDNIAKKLEGFSSEMASRIDAHSRQIMEHLHREIQQWKNRMDGQITNLAEEKVDRRELTTRLARIASAAMGDAVPPTPPPSSPPPFGTEPFGQQAPVASPVPNLSSLDAFAMPADKPGTPDDYSR